MNTKKVNNLPVIVFALGLVLAIGVCTGLFVSILLPNMGGVVQNIQDAGNDTKAADQLKTLEAQATALEQEKTSLQDVEPLGTMQLNPVAPITSEVPAELPPVTLAPPVVSAAPDNEPPPAVTNLAGRLNICYTNEIIYIKFSWSAVQDGSGSPVTYEWELLRAHMEKEDYQHRASGTTTETNIETLVECGYQYRVRVRAIDANGNIGEWMESQIKLQKSSVTPTPKP